MSAFNDGWAYRDRPAAAAPSIAAWYAVRYPHSTLAVWGERLATGQIWRNGQQLWGDGPLAAGDRLVWHRPPWQEAAVPALPSPLFDDGDLVVFNKPSGLPVLPAGGFLRHTLLGQLEDQVAAGVLDATAGKPCPVHRLGRFTSGLLVCARSRAARAHLSAQLRDSTAAVVAPQPPNPTANKVYRALLAPPPQAARLAALGIGQTCQIDTPIGRGPHPQLGSIWCAATALPGAPQAWPAALPASSRVTLLQDWPLSWLVEVAIATGRPHQIRIHAAAAGAPLLGDPLYVPGGLARPDALPGDGGYRLHAHRFSLSTLDGHIQHLEAPLPPELRYAADGFNG